jgi:hypothetical protein
MIMVRQRTGMTVMIMIKGLIQRTEEPYISMQNVTIYKMTEEDDDWFIDSVPRAEII